LAKKIVLRLFWRTQWPISVLSVSESWAATKRLLDAGHSVFGYNRTKSKAQWLLDAGMKWADSPRAAAESSKRYFP
jgi:hypothetical protein